MEVKECADMVSQLRRIGKGYPVFQYDQYTTLSPYKSLCCMHSGHGFMLAVTLLHSNYIVV